MTAPSARAWTVLREALALPAGEREAFVQAQCANEAGLRDEVLTLLRLDAGIDSAFDAPLDPARTSDGWIAFGTPSTTTSSPCTHNPSSTSTWDPSPVRSCSCGCPTTVT